jgi:hypothetical protein
MNEEIELTKSPSESGQPEPLCNVSYDTMGEPLNEIMHRGFLLAQMLRTQKRYMKEEEKEAVDYFIIASYSTENPPLGFTAETWKIVGEMHENQES